MKTVEILLNENVDSLGIVGDVVKVRSGYARNYLLPYGLAIAPTKGNVARLAARRAEVEKKLKEVRAQQEALLVKLEGYELTIQRSANEQGVLFGGVTARDVAEAMRAEGYAVEDRVIRMGAQIKRLDSYEVPVVLAADLRTTIKLWVVSDKPMEELQSEEAKEHEGAPKESGEVAVEPPARAEKKAKK